MYEITKAERVYPENMDVHYYKCPYCRVVHVYVPELESDKMMEARGWGLHLRCKSCKQNFSV